MFRPIFLVFAVGLGLTSQAATVQISFTKLTGLSGGFPAETAIYKADLTGVLTSIQSIMISDNSSLLGGAPGKFTGFDLDAIRLSYTDCADAACAAAAQNVGGFDFGLGTQVLPGAQRSPADSRLFGTRPGGISVDQAVASPEIFDANSTTGPGANGFLSLGDNGKLVTNFSSPANSTGLFLYIGEVEDNGEFAAAVVDVSDKARNIIPEPSTSLLLGSALMGLAMLLRRKKA